MQKRGFRGSLGFLQEGVGEGAGGEGFIFSRLRAALRDPGHPGKAALDRGSAARGPATAAPAGK